MDFDQLSPASGPGQLASTAELIRGRRNASLDYGADTRVEIHSRIVKPLLDITLLFLGLPLVVTRQNCNVFLCDGAVHGRHRAVLGFCLVLAYVGGPGPCPPLGAWMPLMVLFPWPSG